MAFQKEYLDLLLVPSGLFIMFTYHLYLLYKYLTIPHTTIMGFENNDKRAWVERIMQVKFVRIKMDSRFKLDDFEALISIEHIMCF